MFDKFCPKPRKAGVIGVPCTVYAAAEPAGIKLVGVPQPKPCIDFHQISRICLPQLNLERIRLSGGVVSGKNCCHGNTFKIFLC